LGKITPEELQAIREEAIAWHNNNVQDDRQAQAVINTDKKQTLK
jgi:hypothetical protein